MMSGSFVRSLIGPLVIRSPRLVSTLRWGSSDTATQPTEKDSSGTRDLLLRQFLMDDQVAKITLNDPRRRNALSLSMLEQLKRTLQEFSSNKTIRAVVITAEPPVFSSGHDLRELRSETGLTHHAKVFTTCTEVMKLVQDIDIPVIGQVYGLAAAAGCQLLASCDIVVASENASFSVPGAKAGLFCSTPGVALARAVPRKVALDMLLTGQPIGAQAAYRAGLVSRIAAEDAVEGVTEDVCNAICHLSRPVISAGKSFFYMQAESDRNTAYRHGERVMLENLRLSDCQEGISGFLEKRQPVWSHSLKKVH